MATWRDAFNDTEIKISPAITNKFCLENLIKPSPEHVPDSYEHVDNAKGKMFVFSTNTEKEVHNIKQHLSDLVDTNGYFSQHLPYRNRKDVEDGVKKILDNVNTTETSCLITFFFGTSKDKERFLLEDDEYISATDVWTEFTSDKCPALKNIPKIFIFHGYRQVSLVYTDNKTKRKSQMYKFDVPAETDILLVFNETDSNHEDQFIRNLAEKLRVFGRKEDMTTLVTLSETQNRPLIISTLTRKFYFCPSELRHHQLDHHERNQTIHALLDDLI